MAETHSAENVAGLTQAPEPCWYGESPDGNVFEYGDGSPHWGTEAEGREFIASTLKEYEVSLRRETEPCWHLTCDECGYRYDEDEWVSHFMSRLDAANAAEDCDWHVVDGRLLCPECYLSTPAPDADSEAGK